MPCAAPGGSALNQFIPCAPDKLPKMMLRSPWSQSPDLDRARLDLEALVLDLGSDFPAGRPWLLQPVLELTCSGSCQGDAWLVLAETKHRNNQGGKIQCGDEMKDGSTWPLF